MVVHIFSQQSWTTACGWSFSLGNEQTSGFLSAKIKSAGYEICDSEKAEDDSVFSHMTSCILANIYRHFGGTRYLHLQDKREQQSSYHETSCRSITCMFQAFGLILRRQ
jgi:hypothetical protein